MSSHENDTEKVVDASLGWMYEAAEMLLDPLEAAALRLPPDDILEAAFQVYTQFADYHEIRDKNADAYIEVCLLAIAAFRGAQADHLRDAVTEAEDILREEAED